MVYEDHCMHTTKVHDTKYTAHRIGYLRLTILQVNQKLSNYHHKEFCSTEELAKTSNCRRIAVCIWSWTVGYF